MYVRNLIIALFVLIPSVSFGGYGSDYFDFDITPETAVSHSSGRLHWNNTVDAFEFDGKILLDVGDDAGNTYLFTTCGGNCLALQSQLTGAISHLRLMSKDGDGTDNVFMSIHGIGTPEDTSNRERLIVGYNKIDDDYHIITDHSGTGSSKSLHFGVKEYQSMLTLDASDGTVDFKPADSTDAIEYLDQSDNTVFIYDSSNDRFGFGHGSPLASVDVFGATRIGDSTTNYSEFDSSGSLSFNGVSRIAWQKYTANSVTITVGGTDATSVVANLQTSNDGNVFHLDEVAASPAIEFYAEFVSVTAFNWVKVLACYEGSTTHALELELYNWSGASWDHFSSLQDAESNFGTLFQNESFFVPDDSAYIGTGGDAGKVRVRVCHPMNGNVSHDIYVDIVSLYQ